VLYGYALKHRIKDKKSWLPSPANVLLATRKTKEEKMAPKGYLCRIVAIIKV
jgi:hypothetical protein